MQIHLISSRLESEFIAKVNLFLADLEKDNKEFVDIQYQCICVGTHISNHTALILYK